MIGVKERRKKVLFSSVSNIKLLAFLSISFQTSKKSAKLASSFIQSCLKELIFFQLVFSLLKLDRRRLSVVW